jgi:hypothetical protein
MRSRAYYKHCILTPQVLLQSKAIEISLENAFEAGLSQAQGELLAHLLLTFFGWLEAADAKSLSSALVRVL